MWPWYRSCDVRGVNGRRRGDGPPTPFDYVLVHYHISKNEIVATTLQIYFLISVRCSQVYVVRARGYTRWLSFPITSHPQFSNINCKAHTYCSYICFDARQLCFTAWYISSVLKCSLYSSLMFLDCVYLLKTHSVFTDIAYDSRRTHHSVIYVGNLWKFNCMGETVVIIFVTIWRDD